jgi:hypothetical protein
MHAAFITPLLPEGEGGIDNSVILIVIRGEWLCVVFLPRCGHLLNTLHQNIHHTTDSCFAADEARCLLDGSPGGRCLQQYVQMTIFAKPSTQVRSGPFINPCLSIFSYIYNAGCCTFSSRNLVQLNIYPHVRTWLMLFTFVQ